MPIQKLKKTEMGEVFADRSIILVIYLLQQEIDLLKNLDVSRPVHLVFVLIHGSEAGS